jgi:hypothetical protein
VAKEGYIGAVMKINNDLSRAYLVQYDEEKLGYTPRENTNGLLTLDGSFVFYSVNKDLNMLNINTVSKEGEISTKQFNTNGNRLDCLSLVMAEDIIVTGQYFKENDEYFEGVFCAQVINSEIEYFPFEKLKGTENIPEAFHYRRINMNTKLSTHYEKETNQVFMVWAFKKTYLTGAILIAKYTLADNSMESLFLYPDPDLKITYRAQRSFISSDKLAIIIESEANNGKIEKWELLEVDIENISSFSWSTVSVTGIEGQYDLVHRTYDHMPQIEYTEILQGYRSFRLAKISY